ncbi:hypothetical protein RRG08_003583 [Elysia crispata]|uniref:Mpv17-like protein n=1 Tax=Elysia crispata TaxID=231223 RepID=A0AAE0YII5_9GAST|nr:hypothetical protein RRG08_003583 [Elysia crispata]
MASYFSLDWSQENSLFVNIGSVMICALLADIALQVLYERRTADQEQRQWSYSCWRTVRVVIVTGILATIGHKWYNLLDEVYATPSAKDIAAKVVLDEVIMAPFMVTSSIFALRLLEGNNPKRIYHEWKEKFTAIYQSDVLVWPNIQLVNFLVVPALYRDYFISLCTFMWNIYLIHAIHSPSRIPAPKWSVWDKQQRGDLELTSH